MTAIRPSMPAVRVTPARAAAPAAAVKAAAPVAKPVARVLAQPKAEAIDTKHVLKTVGVGAGAFAGSSVATWVADLFFHFGNNGGTAFAGGVYLAVAGLAAVGAMAAYHHFKK